MLFPTLMEPPRWTGHLLLAKQRDDFVWPHPGVSILEYPLDDPGRFFIHNQLIVVVRGFAIGLNEARYSPAFALARMDERILRELSRL